MARTFFRGVPTAVDVKTLDDFFKVPAEGALIRWTEIEEVLKMQKDSYRYKTVVHTWRKKLLREHNILLVAEIGKGLTAATPDARIDWSGKKVAQGRRYIIRGSTVAATTDKTRLTESNKESMAFLIDIPKRLRLIESLAMQQKEA